MRRPIRCLLASAMLLMSGPAAAADYSVSYNPYATVDWGSTLRCQSQHHDHAYDANKIIALDAAGYCAVTFMTYSGRYQQSAQQVWATSPPAGLGQPDPDPGQPTGFGPPRRWPPESYGAPSLPLTNLKFYLPGAEEIGLYANGNLGAHVQSTFMTTYIEGSGCLACGDFLDPNCPEGQTCPHLHPAVANANLNGLPASQIHGSSQELIDRIVQNGGHATMNHPVGPPNAFQQYSNFGSMEMFNNYFRNTDDRAGTDTQSDQMMAIWDYTLEHKSPRIWGVAANDWFSAWTPLGQSALPASLFPVTTEQNRDRGKLQVLLTSYDLASYRIAFEAGAFFAIVENNAIKAAYPTVSNIAVTPNSISIATVAGTETVEWIGNGVPVGSGPTLSLNDLPAGLVYVRAEIDDGQGRTVYSQPFSLGDPLPPIPVPALPPRLPALLALLLLVAVSWMVARVARRS